MDLRAGTGLSRLLCQRLRRPNLSSWAHFAGCAPAFSTPRARSSTLGPLPDSAAMHWAITSSGLRNSGETRAAQGRHADFWQVTGDALDFSLETLNLEAPGLRDRLMALYLTLDPFPEVRDVLGRLRALGLRTAIYRTARRQCSRQPSKAAKLGALLDEILSVEEVGVYKPHPKVYQLAIDRLVLLRHIFLGEFRVKLRAHTGHRGSRAWAIA